MTMTEESIRNEYEEKLIGVLREREGEILSHYSSLRERVERARQSGEWDDEECAKRLNNIEGREFKELHELDILLMKIRKVGLIDFRTEVFE